MGRPKRIPYSNLSRDRWLSPEQPDGYLEYLQGKLCPKVKGIWKHQCDNASCEVATGKDGFLFVPDMCGRRACILCSRAGDKKRALRLLERMSRKGIGIWVFTLPKPFDTMISGQCLRELETRFRKKLENLYLDETGCRIGYRQMWHPSGDHCSNCGHEVGSNWKPHISAMPECPKCFATQQPHPHLNFIIPLWGWDVDPERRPDHIENPIMIPLKQKLRPKFILKVKAAWAECVTECFAAHPELNLPPMIVRGHEDDPENMSERIKNGEICVANAHYQFVKPPTNETSMQVLIHRFKYFARAFPAWEQSLKTALHQGRDYGLLMVASRGNTKEAREKYRETLRFDRSEIEGSDDDMDDRNKKPVCPCCLTGRLSIVGRLSNWDAKKGKQIAGPFNNKGSPPKMEFTTWQKPPPNRPLSLQNPVLSGSKPSGQGSRILFNTSRRSQKQARLFLGTSKNVWVNSQHST